VTQIFLLTIGFVVFRYIIRFISKLPNTGYFEPFMAVEFVKLLPGQPLILVLTGLLGAFLIFTRRKTSHSWNELPRGSAIRFLVISCALILTWAYSCYGYNYYYHQWHHYDRVLLVVLCALLIRFPVFTIPFVFQVSIIAWQSSFNEDWISWAFLDSPLNLLILFAVNFLASSITRSWNQQAFIFLTICFIGSHYSSPGLTKLKLGWFWDNQVHLFLPSTYSNGWLAMLDAHTIGSITRALQPFDAAIRLGVFIMECVAPYLLLSGRRYALVFIPLWALLHIAIFGMSGICLWMWVACEVALFVLILKNHDFYDWAGLPSLKLGLTGIAIVGSSFLWLEPAKLSWMDSGINYVYNFEVECHSGRYGLSPGYFTPFDFRFAVSDFGFLVHEPLLPVKWGATNRKTAEGLRSLVTAKDILVYENLNGTILYDEEKTKWFIHKVETMVTNINGSRAFPRSLGYLESPPTVVRFGKTNSWDGQEAIEKLHISQSLWYFDGENPQEIRRIPLIELEIP